MTDRALRELERAAGHDPAARSRLLEARIRAGGRDPRRDPFPGDLLEVASPVWRRPDGTPSPIVREVVGLSDVKIHSVRKGTITRDWEVSWRWLAVPNGYCDDRNGPPRKCSLATWRRWAKAARIVDPFEEDHEGRRPHESATRIREQPCERYRPCPTVPAYCWCGWIDTKHAGAPAEEPR